MTEVEVSGSITSSIILGYNTAKCLAGQTRSPVQIRGLDGESLTEPELVGAFGSGGVAEHGHPLSRAAPEKQSWLWVQTSGALSCAGRMGGMELNPYESPRETATHPPFNWRRLFWRGLRVAGVGFILLALVLVFSHPHFNGLLAIACIVAAVTAGIVFHVGLIMAIVGGIGWVLSPRSVAPAVE
jgi:hypothetical protein